MHECSYLARRSTEYNWPGLGHTLIDRPPPREEGKVATNVKKAKKILAPCAPGHFSGAPCSAGHFSGFFCPPPPEGEGAKPKRNHSL